MRMIALAQSKSVENMGVGPELAGLARRDYVRPNTEYPH
jgi:hypothetical protein